MTVLTLKVEPITPRIGLVLKIEPVIAGSIFSTIDLRACTATMLA